MQLVEMLMGKELSMKREVFAKNTHFIGGVLIVKEEGRTRENERLEETKIRVLFWMLPKVNTDEFCVN